MTKIVNIYSDAYDVYIGRPGKGQDGYFGNPHPVGMCYICHKSHNRDEAVDIYEKEFNERIKTDPEFKKRILELKDKTLGCFCKSKIYKLRCHGDVIVSYLDNPHD